MEEWQKISVESSVDAAVCPKCSVVFLCLVNHSEFVQLMGKCLIGVHVVEVGVVARPVELAAFGAAPTEPRWAILHFLYLLRANL